MDHSQGHAATKEGWGGGGSKGERVQDGDRGKGRYQVVGVQRARILESGGSGQLRERRGGTAPGLTGVPRLPPYDPRQRPTVESQEGAVSYERGTPGGFQERGKGRGACSILVLRSVQGSTL